MIDGDRVNALLHDTAYLETVGKWIKEEHEALPTIIADEDDPIKSARLRGRFQAYNEILQRMQSCLMAAESDSRKLHKE